MLVFPVYHYIGCDSKIARELLLGPDVAELVRRDGTVTYRFCYSDIVDVQLVLKDHMRLTLCDRSVLILSRPGIQDVVTLLMERRGTSDDVHACKILQRNEPSYNKRLPVEKMDIAPLQPVRDAGSLASKLDKITGTSFADRLCYFIQNMLRANDRTVRGFATAVGKTQGLAGLVGHYRKVFHETREMLLGTYREPLGKMFEGQDEQIMRILVGEEVERFMMGMAVPQKGKPSVRDVFLSAIQTDTCHGGGRASEHDRDIENALVDMAAFRSALQFLNDRFLVTYETFGVRPALHSETGYSGFTDRIQEFMTEWKQSPLLPHEVITRFTSICTYGMEEISTYSAAGIKERKLGRVMRVGSEDLNPVFEMCLARANAPEIAVAVIFASLFSDRLAFNSDKGYYLLMALAVLKTIIEAAKTLRDMQPSSTTERVDG